MAKELTTERRQGGRLRQMAERGLNLLYPPDLYCICCGNLIDETRTYHLCDHCISHIRWDGAEVKELNGLKILRCVQYGLYERTLIFSLKYNGRKYIARTLGQIMADRIALAGIDFDVIVPVPLFAAKEKQRGFNHAALMGRYLGMLTDRPCAEHGLLRTAQTLPMRGLSPAEREFNVKDKFTANPAYADVLKNRTVLLIDDFYTTGSTAGECLKALKAAGVSDVYFLAFAAK